MSEYNLETMERYPTRHLIEKMSDRQVTWAEILDVVDHPEVVYGPDRKGRSVYQKGDLGVVASRDGNIITVLLRQEENWTSEEVRNRGTKDDQG